MSSKARSGTIIEGKFRLERELGAGGMGAVWLATQVTVDRKVAVKLLHPAFLDQEELQKRFEVEAKAIAKLNHPNCITLFDFGFSEDLQAFYTVIEFIDGVSLDKKLGSPMSPVEAITIIKSVALALDHAHHKGILHRDLKPENIMVAKNEQGGETIKVLDFGIARMMKGDDFEESQRITKAGEVFGTPAYMSPEQARSVRQVTPAADLYSLGVMFYELLEGRLPFFSNSAFDLLMMHVTKPVPPMTRLDVPEELKAAVMKLLDKEPQNRFQTGRELAEHLDLILNGMTPAAEVTAQTPAHSGEFTRSPTPQPTIATPPGVTVQLPSDLQTDEYRPGQFTTNVDVGGKKGVVLGALLFAGFVLVSVVVYFAINLGDDAGASEIEPVAEAPVEPRTNVEQVEDTPAEPSVSPEEHLPAEVVARDQPDAGIPEETRVDEVAAVEKPVEAPTEKPVEKPVERPVQKKTVKKTTKPKTTKQKVSETEDTKPTTKTTKSSPFQNLKPEDSKFKSFSPDK